MSTCILSAVGLFNSLKLDLLQFKVCFIYHLFTDVYKDKLLLNSNPSILCYFTKLSL